MYSPSLSHARQLFGHCSASYSSAKCFRLCSQSHKTLWPSIKWNRKSFLEFLFCVTSRESHYWYKPIKRMASGSCSVVGNNDCFTAWVWKSFPKKESKNVTTRNNCYDLDSNDMTQGYWSIEPLDREFGRKNESSIRLSLHIVGLAWSSKNSSFFLSTDT